MSANPALGFRIALEARCTGGLAFPPNKFKVAGRAATRAEHDAVRHRAHAFEHCHHASVNGVHTFYCTAVVAEEVRP